MSGSGEAPGVMDIQAVVGVGRPSLRGDADEGLGGRTGGEGGGDGRDRDIYGERIRWEDTVANSILGTDPNTLFSYALGL